VLAADPNRSADDINDLERYLDVTKSNLLFARKVMLVEGAAEVFLIPSLVKKIMEVDLEREGISVIPIHGVHFGAFARLFSDHCLPKRCAIVADADLEPGEPLESDGYDDEPAKPDIAALEGTYVKAFLGATTFEREIAHVDNLEMLSKTCAELGAPKIKDAIALAQFLGEVDDELKDKVLRTAKRFGKARFAQVAARHVDEAGAIPDYIFEAVKWLLRT
jgi:putative ATP-dependent endonuclease of OLD family